MDTTKNIAYASLFTDHKAANPEIRLNIYPNPVIDIVRITGLEGNYSIKMLDVLGQVVASAKGSSDEQVFDLSKKPTGIYLVKIESQGKSITRKLIKK